MLQTFKTTILLLFLGLSAALWAGRETPPVLDTLNIKACTLSHVVLDAAAPSSAAMFNGKLKINRKQYPKSVQAFLKPSGLIDHQHMLVRKAALKAIKRLPEAGRQDPARVLAAVSQYLNTQLKPASTEAVAEKSSTDYRKAWPKASALLKLGKVDAVGRVRVGAGILRALGVPARPCLVDGAPRLQAWMQYASPAKASKTNKNPVRGFWAVEGLLDPNSRVDAWSLDSGELARLRWQPEQELSAKHLGSPRACFAMADEAQARALFASLTLTGSMSPASMPAWPEGAKEAWVIAAESYQVQTEGTLQPMNELSVLAPYIPHQARWGLEARPWTVRQDIVARALWTDRPERLSVPKAWLEGDWERAKVREVMGEHHYLSCKVRRGSAVLQAQFQGLTLTGVVLRPDNLAPLQNAQLSAQFNVPGFQPLSSTTDAKGQFEWVLPKVEGASELRLRAKLGAREDLQVLPVYAPESLSGTTGF
jgi:hypothetical protein